MKKNLFKIIFVASFALNLAFVGAWIFRAEKDKKIIEKKGVILNGQYELGDKQKTMLDKIVKSFRTRLAENRSKVLEKRIDVIELLGDPDQEGEAYDEFLLQLNETENELNRDFISTLKEIGSILDQEQWINFLYNVSKGWFFSNTI